MRNVNQVGGMFVVLQNERNCTTEADVTYFLSTEFHGNNEISLTTGLTDPVLYVGLSQ